VHLCGRHDAADPAKWSTISDVAAASARGIDWHPWFGCISHVHVMLHGREQTDRPAVHARQAHVARICSAMQSKGAMMTSHRTIHKSYAAERRRDRHLTGVTRLCLSRYMRALCASMFVHAVRTNMSAV